MLQSYTPEAAAPVVAALVIATALLAQARAAAEAVPVLQISFVKLLSLLRALWLTLDLFGDLLTARQRQALLARFWAHARRLLTPRRLPRSFPRVVRQPMRGWPLNTRDQSWQGPLDFKLLPLNGETPKGIRPKEVVNNKGNNLRLGRRLDDVVPFTVELMRF